MSQRKTERLDFENRAGRRLSAVLDAPRDTEPASTPTVVFAHCFTCGKDLASAARLSRALVARGFAVLRFDFTGLGESEGSFQESTLSSNVADLVDAAAMLRARFRAPSLLVGHSLGGAAALLASSEIPEVEAVATIGAPSDPQHLREGVLSAADPEQGCSMVDIGGRPFPVSRELLEDLDNQSLLQAVRELRKPLLILHSPVDDIVSVDHARALYEAAKHPKSFVSLDRADHLLLENAADARFVAEVLSSWASRYVTTPEVSAPEIERPDLGLEQVRVRGGRSKFTNTVWTDDHQLVTDEPERVGGANLGPDPYEMLLGGLGSCISMTLRMYADRKQIPLDEVEVQLRHRRVHAKDCDECESADGLVDVIEKRVEVFGEELISEQRERLLEIAGRCPVHKTLTTETRIESVERFES